MDLAFACLPGQPGLQKRREHFHSFMLATHHALHKLGQEGGSKTRDTVALYASEISSKTSVLCLDEFQVVDVADAMIIRRLLDRLWLNGVVLVTTSNRAPAELYKNGLNRAQFVPCIEAIQSKCAVHEMRSARDYRLTGHAAPDESEGASERAEAEGRGTWLVAPADDPAAVARADAWLTSRLSRLAKNDRMVTVDVAMSGRRIRVNRASGGVARLTFDEACASALGAGDYTAIASVFHTVGLEGVPRMSMDRVDLMRRFITFVDVLYEHKVKLLATAAETPENLFLGSVFDARSVSDKNANQEKTKTNQNANVDEAFAWDRAASRLAEMSSSEYVEAPWRPKSGAWLLEQAKVTEVVPESVLRALWQRYDADHNGVLDESELECLLGDLNEMRRGHRNVPEEQLSSAWEVLTNRGKRGVRQSAGLGMVDSKFETCDEKGGPKQKPMPSRKGDAFITFDDFIDYGNDAFAACMVSA
jgi:predicted ATPase